MRGRVVQLGLPVLLATATTVLVGLIFPDSGIGWLIVGWLVQVAASIVMVTWRLSCAPMVLLSGVTALFAFAPIGWQPAFAVNLTIWIPSMATYSMARLVSAVRSRIEVGVGIAALAAWIAIMVSPRPVTLLSLLASAAPPLSGACFALLIRLRNARRDRIAFLARERELESDRRAAAERERIAADLHDLVTHQMVRIVFQARNLADHTGERPTRSAADEIAGTATTALTQMRDFLRTTRSTEPEPTEDDETTAGELAEQIASIVGDERALGRSVDAVPPVGADDVRLAPAAAGCLVRGVHEGVVNAAKHAPEAAVRISSTVDHDQYVVVIENGLSTSGPRELAGTGSGTGLRGLSRRAALIGGAASVSSTEDRFRLEIRVPVLG